MAFRLAFLMTTESFQTSKFAELLVLRNIFTRLIYRFYFITVCPVLNF